MPSAENFEWPQGNPLFEVQWRSVTESLAGNGVLSNGDFQVTGTANTREINIAGGTLYYIATEYSFGGSIKQISVGDGTYDRWDTVYYDTATNSIGVREGTPEQYPEPPDIQGDEFLIAIVYVPQGFDNTFSSDQILNWRPKFSNEAEEVHYNDNSGDYGVTDVEAALDAIDLDFVRGRDNTITSVLASLGANPGTFGAIIDATVDSNSSAGTPHSYTLELDSGAFVEVYAESDGAGGIQNARVDLLQTVRASGDIETTGGTTIWDSSNGWVPQSQLEGPPSQLSSYPLPIGDLDTPYPLPDVTDMDAAGNDLTDSTSGDTIWDTSAGVVPRTSVDDEKVITSQEASGTNGSFITSGEEVVLVDTATNTTPYTVTLGSADANPGNHILVADDGGGATSNNITVNTEGSETIDGASSLTINRNYASALFVSDGTNWFEVGGVGLRLGIKVEDDGSTILNPAFSVNYGRGINVTNDGDESVTLDYEHREVFEGRESGTVSAGNQGVLIMDNLGIDETVQIYKAVLVNADATPVASSVDLELVAFDNAGGFTSQATIISGDGSTVFDDETGTPLATYTNTSGAAQTIGVIVDNGTAGGIDIIAAVEGATGT